MSPLIIIENVIFKTYTKVGFTYFKFTFYIKKYRSYKLVQSLWRTVWRFLKKLEIELPYDPAIPLLGIHTEPELKETHVPQC